MSKLKSTLFSLGACAALSIFSLPGAAAYPERAIKIIVPIAPGSVTDVIMRKASDPLAKELGQPVIIENRPGASGIIGAQSCAGAEPDGYTICAIYHATTSYNPLFQENLPYNPDTDFTYITRLFFLIEGIAVSAATGAQSMAEIRDFVKSNPTKVSFGTLGDKSVQQLMIGWLNQTWNSDIVGVAYKGGGPIALAIGANEIQMGQMGIGNFVNMLEAKKLNLVSVNSETRSPLLPEVPTMKELDLKGFETRSWWGIAAPKGLPPEIADKLHAAFDTVFTQPELQSFFHEQYVEVATNTPAEFAEFIEADRTKAESLVRLYDK